MDMGLTRAINEARRAAGVGEQSVDFARPVEEGRGTHEAIGASSVASRQATAELCEELGALIKAHPGSIAARALLVVDFIDQVRNLGYSEYRMLVGLIHRCRNDATGAALPKLFEERDGLIHLSQAVPRALETLEHIYKTRVNEVNEGVLAPAGHNGLDPELHEKIAEQTMMLLRTVHPLGVNIRNPEWKEERGEIGYPAHKMVGLHLGGEHGVESAARRECGALIVKPRGETSVVKFIPFGERWDDVATGAVIGNGEGVIVGRPLSIPQKLFGIALSKSIEVPVGVALDRDDVAWSRGSLYVYRSNDGRELFILDRGTKSPIVSPDELGAIQTFIPKTIIEGGSVSFGHSISERPRRLGG